MSPKNDKDKTIEGFSAEEKAAMKELIKERKAASANGEADVLAKLAELPEPDRSMGMRLHELVKFNAPDLVPRTWYGMPAYAKDGKVVCHFQSAQKFKTRYSTIGFSDSANLDDGDLWPVAFALKELTPKVEAKVIELVKRAAG